MDLKDIKQVIDLMKTAELTSFDLEKKGFRLHLSRKEKEVAPQVTQATPISVTPIPTATFPTVEAPAGTPAAPIEGKGIEVIKSPMVGTFYRAPSPESPVFIEIGAAVAADSVVCIIEAMKVLNEIQAEISGTIIEVLVEDGDAVEYGQPLFKVKTA